MTVIGDIHAQGIRRVVTGHNAAGRSVFVVDAAAPHVYNRGPGSAVVTDVWRRGPCPPTTAVMARSPTIPFPACSAQVRHGLPHHRISARQAIRAHGAALASEASGQRGNSIVRAHSASEDARERADDTRPEPGSSARAAFDRGSPRHPGFHKTSSVDYAIVLSGEIYALMDEGEVLLKAGDVLVQRGTNHAWSNRTDAPAYLAFVLVDAEPV